MTPTTRVQVTHATRPGETALYRLFAGDALLYVGIAEEPIRRWYTHTYRSWWPQVTAYEVAWYPSRDEALKAERAAIVAEEPRHNVVFNREGGSRSCGSPTVTALVLKRFQGRQFSIHDVAEESGFSLTSASNTMRALVATGAAVLIGSPRGSQRRFYRLVDAAE